MSDERGSVACGQDPLRRRPGLLVSLLGGVA